MKTPRDNRLRPLGAAGPKILAGGVVFLLVVLLITSVFGKKGLMETQRTRKNYEAQVLELKKLERRKAELERQIAELERNPRAVEQTAREKLWLMRKDEVVVVDKKR